MYIIILSRNTIIVHSFPIFRLKANDGEIVVCLSLELTEARVFDKKES